METIEFEKGIPSRIVLFKSIGGYDKYALRITPDECLSWGGLCICDWCNEVEMDDLYFLPDLGFKVSCKKCFEDYTKRAKFYLEDLPYSEECVNTFCEAYHIKLTDSEKAWIDKYYEVMSKLDGDDDENDEY